MKKGPKIYRQCLRKTRFQSLDFAEKVAKKRSLSVYFCECCLSYHLTKLAQRPARSVVAPEVKRRTTLYDRPISHEDENYFYTKPSSQRQQFRLMSKGWEMVTCDGETYFRMSKKVVYRRERANLGLPD